MSESPYTDAVRRRAEHVRATGAVALDESAIALALTVLDEMRDPIEHPVAHVFFPKYRASVATGIPFGKVRALSHIDAALRHSWGRAASASSRELEPPVEHTPVEPLAETTLVSVEDGRTA